MSKSAELKTSIRQKLPLFMLILFILQPLLDVTSFWQEQLGIGNTVTLALRFVVLAVVALLGFFLSDRKKCYYIFAACCIFLLAGHCLACSIKGYENIFSDLTNFVRVAQMPLFTICFITFLRQNKDCYQAIKKGFVYNFIIISAIVLISVLSNTYLHTYEYSQLGILGWFSTSNAQSAILSFMTPIVIMLAHQQKKPWLVAVAVLASFAQLYFLGTRLAFLALACTAIGIPFVLIVNKEQWRSTTAILLIGLILCLATIKLSPMYRNQTLYNMEMSSKQGDAMAMMGKELEEGFNIYTIDWDSLDKEEAMRLLTVVYEYYRGDLVERFGVEKVMEEYNYSHTITDITGTRYRKIIFCRLLQQEHPPLSKVFGMELARMSYKDTIYDVENDFHGIYFLYGAVGLVMMIAFIGYFIFLIVKALTQDAKKYFTLDAGAFGIAFCLALAYAYNTAGVLRRPNSSFYLSLLLAVIYYLVKLHPYPQTSQPVEKKRPRLFATKAKRTQD